MKANRDKFKTVYVTENKVYVYDRDDEIPDGIGVAAGCKYVRIYVRPPVVGGAENVFAPISEWTAEVDRVLTYHYESRYPEWYNEERDLKRAVKAVEKWAKKRILTDVRGLTLTAGGGYCLCDCSDIVLESGVHVYVLAGRSNVTVMREGAMVESVHGGALVCGGRERSFGAERRGSARPGFPQERAASDSLVMPTLAWDKVVELTKEAELTKGGDPSSKYKKQIDFIEKFPWCALEGRMHIKDAQERRELIENVEAALDARLFGLERAKKETVRWYASTLYKPDAPVRGVLYVGPAGTGKTTMPRVIAEALGMQVAFISMPTLSTVNDLAGADKTWKNPQPGRVVKAIADYGEMPVFIFDEVDKVKPGKNNGDSCQVLLSMADDSRAEFKDAYLDVPVDLSRVPMFFTANDITEVSPYLRDRLTVIEIDGYNSPSERRTLLTDYVIPAVYEQQGLTKEQFVFDDEAVELILKYDIDHGGSVRPLQMGAETVAKEAIYVLDTDPSAEMPIKLTAKAIGEALQRGRSQAAKQNKIGFGSAISGEGPDNYEEEAV